MNARIARLVPAAFLAMVAAFVRLIGLLLLMFWAIWCTCALALIGVAVRADALGWRLRVSFTTGPKVWLYTAVGVVAVVCILLSRWMEAWAQPAVDDEHATANLPGHGSFGRRV